MCYKSHCIYFRLFRLTSHTGWARTPRGSRTSKINLGASTNPPTPTKKEEISRRFDMVCVGEKKLLFFAKIIVPRASPWTTPPKKLQKSPKWLTKKFGVETRNKTTIFLNVFSSWLRFFRISRVVDGEKSSPNLFFYPPPRPPLFLGFSPFFSSANSTDH